jgi:hypothetical protein
MARRATPHPPWGRTARLLAAGELPVLVLAWVLAVVLGPDPNPDPNPHPERFTARISTCDVRAAGGAAISYTLANGDRTGHGYKVELTVTTAGSVLGAGTSLVPWVDAGATVSGRALVPLQGDAAGAACQARGVVFDGQTGHRH